MSLGDIDKMQILTQKIYDGTWQSAFLMSSKLLLTFGLCGEDLEDEIKEGN